METLTKPKRMTQQQKLLTRGPYHEAGHAWQAWKNGNVIESLTHRACTVDHTLISRLMETADDDKFDLPDCLLPLAEREIRFNMAGIAATVVHERCQPIYAYLNTGGSDIDKARAIASRFKQHKGRAADLWVDVVERDVRKELKQPDQWVIVEAIAQRLIEVGTTGRIGWYDITAIITKASRT